MNGSKTQKKPQTGDSDSDSDSDRHENDIH